MYAASITNDDSIALYSVTTFMERKGINKNAMSPQEYLVLYNQNRDFLYSEIVRRFPRIAAYIINNIGKEDDFAKGLNESLSHLVIDENFTQLLYSYLNRPDCNYEERIVTGAFLSRVVATYYTNMPKKDSKNKDSEKEIKEYCDKISHVERLITHLIGDIALLIKDQCVGLTDHEALAIASSIALCSEETIPSLIEMDLPVTANLFDILIEQRIANISPILTFALRMKKSEYDKLTKNQDAFVQSLIKWVYDKLNMISMQDAYALLVSAYGTTAPTNTSDLLIQIKDCGTRYSNLLTVAKQLIK